MTTALSFNYWNSHCREVAAICPSNLGVPLVGKTPCYLCTCPCLCVCVCMSMNTTVMSPMSTECVLWRKRGISWREFVYSSLHSCCITLQEQKGNWVAQSGERTTSKLLTIANPTGIRWNACTPMLPKAIRPCCSFIFTYNQNTHQQWYMPSASVGIVSISMICNLIHYLSGHTTDIMRKWKQGTSPYTTQGSLTEETQEHNDRRMIKWRL